MDVMLHSLKEQYNAEYNATKVFAVDSWPFFGSLVPFTCILLVYLLTVLKAGPKFMAHRKPYNLQPLLIAYNFMLVIMSSILTLWPITAGHLTFLVTESCHPVNGLPEERLYDIASLSWYFFMSKIVELVDTVFFVLRKKQNQISFLHVYHHTIAGLLTWIHLKYLPGPQGIVMMFLNSLVHVFMYFYYMISAMGPKYHKYIWWKKYMTVIQLVQFGIMAFFMSGLLILNCALPKLLSIYFISISTNFLLLFMNFYRKTYKEKKHIKDK